MAISFCGVIPVLTLTSLVSIFILYWQAKISLLRKSRKPLFFTEHMAVKSLRIIKVAILMHLVVTGFVWLQFEFVSTSESSILPETAKGIVDYCLKVVVNLGILDELPQTDAILKLQSHQLLYILGSFVFLCVFLSEEVLGLFSFLGSVISFIFQIEKNEQEFLQTQRMH
jgi:hypothetical protein